MFASIAYAHPQAEQQAQLELAALNQSITEVTGAAPAGSQRTGGGGKRGKAGNNSAATLAAVQLSEAQQEQLEVGQCFILPNA